MRVILTLLRRLAPSAVPDTEQIGRAMIRGTQVGYERRVLRPSGIQALVTQTRGAA